jgi:hypothetical protein
MVSRRKSIARQGSGGADFMVWSVVVLFLVFGTMWMVNYLYQNEWAATDPRGSDARSHMAKTEAEQSGAAEPNALPSPPFADFKKAAPAK